MAILRDIRIALGWLECQDPFTMSKLIKNPTKFTESELQPFIVRLVSDDPISEYLW